MVKPLHDRVVAELAAGLGLAVGGKGDAALPRRPWAYTILVTDTHPQIGLKAADSVLDATTQGATSQLQGRVENDVRPTVLINGRHTNNKYALIYTFDTATNVAIKRVGAVEGYYGLFVNYEAAAPVIEGGYFCDNRHSAFM